MQEQTKKFSGSVFPVLTGVAANMGREDRGRHGVAPASDEYHVAARSQERTNERPTSVRTNILLTLRMLYTCAPTADQQCRSMCS